MSYRNEVLKILTSDNDITKLHRAQGSLKTLDDIIELRGQMDEYIKGVSTGQMRRVEKPKENTNGVRT